MQYNDLSEMTIKEWDGTPFAAIVIDNEYQDVRDSDIYYLKAGKGSNRIVGFRNGEWIEDNGKIWKHVYPFSMNKHLASTKRMTNRQLALWLAKGNGEASGVNYVTVFGKWSYSKDEQDREVSEGIRVRKWGSEEWVEPTVDLLEGC